MTWYPPDTTPEVSIATPRKCQHRWESAINLFTGEQGIGCLRCRTMRDPAASRRGRSNARLGKDAERRIERVYGPRKVGEYGDPVDHLGRDFKWQSKATRSAPPRWLAAITFPTWRLHLPALFMAAMAHMESIGGTRKPLVIRSYVRNGVATRDWIFLRAVDWLTFHGLDGPFGFVVIPGPDFLDLHGRDDEVHVGGEG